MPKKLKKPFAFRSRPSAYFAGQTSDVPRRTHDIRRPPSTPLKVVEFAIQLLLDPHVVDIEFRPSITFRGRDVAIDMLIASLNDGSQVGLDLIDERPYRDIDAEGLVLLALQSHNIRLIEVDDNFISREPRASNTRRLWNFREHRVPSRLQAFIDRALAARGRLTIEELGTLTGVRDPMPMVCALVSQGALRIDPSRSLDTDSVVRRRRDRWPQQGSHWLGKTKQ